MTIKILRNATIFDGHGEELTEGGSIVIEGDRIREVGGSSLRCDGAEVVDLDGRFLMPGLLDIHFHAYGITFNMHRMDSRSEEHTSELQSLMRTSYDVFCLKKKRRTTQT